MRQHINHLFLLKTTHARLVENGIEFGDQIPRDRRTLRKMKFTDRQIMDLMEVTRRDLFGLTPEQRLLHSSFGEDLEIYLLLIDGKLFGPCGKKENADRIVEDLSKEADLVGKVEVIRLKTNELGTWEAAESLWLCRTAHR
jgi:hypothetical protein